MPPRPAGALAERWRRRLGVRRRIRLAVSDRCLAPFASGILRPVVHLPSAVANLLSRLAASPELVSVDLKDMRRDGDIYRFSIECSH